MSLIEVISAAGWPIYPLIICSILALAFVVERFLSLRTEKIMPAKLVDEAITVSRNGIPAAEVVNQLEQNSMLGEILASGMRMMIANPRCSEEELRATMEASGRSVAHRLERFLGALGTIEIFGSQGGGTSTGGNPAQLAAGISIALYNTAFGLIVAIPALIFWKYFRAQVDGYLLKLELSTERFFRHLNGLRKR